MQQEQPNSSAQWVLSIKEKMTWSFFIKVMPAATLAFTLFVYWLREVGNSVLFDYLKSHQLIDYLQDVNAYIANFTLIDSVFKSFVYVLIAILVMVIPNNLLVVLASTTTGCYSFKKIASFFVLAILMMLGIEYINFFINNKWILLAVLAYFVIGCFLCVYYYDKYKKTDKHLNTIYVYFTLLYTMSLLAFVWLLRVGKQALFVFTFKGVAIIMLMLLLGVFIGLFFNLFDKIKSKVAKVIYYLLMIISILCAVGSVGFAVTGAQAFVKLPRDLGIGNYYSSLFLRGALKQQLQDGNMLCSLGHENERNNTKIPACYQYFYNHQYVKVWVVLKTNDVLVIAPKEEGRFSMVFTYPDYKYITLIDKHKNLLADSKSNIKGMG